MSNLCQRAITSFTISTFDLALLYGLQNSTIVKPSTIHSNSCLREHRPVIYVIKYKCFLDFLLIPLLFKEAGIDSPAYFVGGTKQVLSMKWHLCVCCSPWRLCSWQVNFEQTWLHHRKGSFAAEISQVAVIFSWKGWSLFDRKWINYDVFPDLK